MDVAGDLLGGAGGTKPFYILRTAFPFHSIHRCIIQGNARFYRTGADRVLCARIKKRVFQEYGSQAGVGALAKYPTAF